MESTADKIVAEVKSQGVFDQFRKDSLAQVDTKPAYINLIQRVKSTVHNFLASKVWSPEMNKIQMRERLRRHIQESSFLEKGVERIVDQVVNPKISTTFQPQIENIAYVALGIDKPKPKNEENQRNQDLQNSMSVIIPNGNLMPEELEQISPDSDKMTIKSDSKGSDSMDTSDDKTEDFESPEFEPIENNSNDNVEEDKSLISIKSEVKVDIKTENDNDKDVTQESNLSQVSSLSIVSESEDTNLHASISEEAQMPRFNENSNSLTEVSTKTSNFTELAFNIKKDEIKFEGTERKIKIESPEIFPEEKLEEKIKVEECKIKLERNGNDNISTDGASVPKFYKEKSRDHHQSGNGNDNISTDGASVPKFYKEKSRDHHQSGNGNDNISTDGASAPKYYKEKSRDHYQSSSSSHKKSSKDKDRERDRKLEKNDKDRKHSSSSSYKKSSSSGHYSSKDRYSNSSSSKSKSKSSEKNGSSKDKHSSKNEKCSTKPTVFRRKSTDSNDDNAGIDKRTSSFTSDGNQVKENSCAEEIKPSGSSDSTSPSDSTGEFFFIFLRSRKAIVLF